MLAQQPAIYKAICIIPSNNTFVIRADVNDNMKSVFCNLSMITADVKNDVDYRTKSDINLFCQAREGDQGRIRGRSWNAILAN